jgi:DNA-directed RNA polymerase specialized sigma24 family protein
VGQAAGSPDREIVHKEDRPEAGVHTGLSVVGASITVVRWLLAVAAREEDGRPLAPSERTPAAEDGRVSPSPNPGDDTAGPLWASELTRLVTRFGSEENSTERAKLRDRIWITVNLAVRRYLRVHRARTPWISSEEIEDVSSQKSLELVERIVSQSWTPADRTAPEVASYISTAARNALADRGRSAGRWVEMNDGDWERVMEEAQPGGVWPSSEGSSVDAAEFAQQLLRCLAALQPRSRYLWFFRAFYDLSSREIAAHPRIQLEVGHVDVLMQRTRSLIQQCLKRAGYETAEIPAGVYPRVWDASRSWGLEPGGES